MRPQSGTPGDANTSDCAGTFKVSCKSRGTAPHPTVTALLILHYKTRVSKRLEILHLGSVFYVIRLIMLVFLPPLFS